MLYGYGRYVEKRKENQCITLYICVSEYTDVVQERKREREEGSQRRRWGERERCSKYIKSIKVELTQNILK